MRHIDDFVSLLKSIWKVMLNSYIYYRKHKTVLNGFCLIVGNRCLSARGKLYMLIQGEEVTCKKGKNGGI